MNKEYDEHIARKFIVNESGIRIWNLQNEEDKDERTYQFATHHLQATYHCFLLW